MTENITVAVRIRPLNQSELNNRNECIWSLNRNTISVSPNYLKELMDEGKMNNLFSTRFSFRKFFIKYIEYCIDSVTSNFSIFDNLVKPIVSSFFEGINDTVITYGPTGSGKTYTMLGNEETRKKLREVSIDSLSKFPDKTPANHEPGILLYALKHIFKSLETESDKRSTLKVSYIEIYNDSIYDLLQEKTGMLNALTVNESELGKFTLKGVIEQQVESISQVLNVIKKGERNRHYAESVMNHNSSRSHTIFQVKLRRVAKDITVTSEIVS